MNPVTIPAQLRPLSHYPAGAIPCPACGDDTRINGGYRSKTGYCRRRECNCGQRFTTYQGPGGVEKVALMLAKGSGPAVGDLRRDLLLLLVAHYQLCKAAGIPFRLDSDEMELAERIRSRKCTY